MKGGGVCVYVCTCVDVVWMCVYFTCIHFFCVWTCVIQIYTQVHTGTPKSQRTMSNIFLNFSLPDLEGSAISHWTRTSLIQQGWQPSPRDPSLPDNTGIASSHWHTLLSSVLVAWDLNSCLYTYAKSRLSIKLCLQPLYFEVWNLWWIAISHNCPFTVRIQPEDLICSLYVKPTLITLCQDYPDHPVSSLPTTDIFFPFMYSHKVISEDFFF